MRLQRLPLALAALASLSLPAIAAETAPADDAAIAAISALGTLNGEALACGQRDNAARLKQLALRHAPKTARFGAALETATQQGFLARTQGSGDCRDAAAVQADTEALSRKLEAVLPPAAREGSN